MLQLQQHPELQVLAVGHAAVKMWRAAAVALPPETASVPALALPQSNGGHVVQSTMAANGAHVLSFVGNSPQATLFAVYTFAEQELGAQYLLSGDVYPPHEYPDEEENLEAPRFTAQNISMKSHFDVRGIQPFHDFSR